MCNYRLLWVDKVESKEGSVSAVIPRSADDINLKDMVLKYQIHNCWPGHCFKEDAKHNLCNYDLIPYTLQKQDGLDEYGIWYNCARFENEDAM